MLSQTRLVRRNAVYYFRARIPADLKAHIGRKREVVESLKTTGKKEAEKLVRIRSVKLDEEFEIIRRRQTAPNKCPFLFSPVGYVLHTRLGMGFAGRGPWYRDTH